MCVVGTRSAPANQWGRPKRCHGFSLLELLVVIGIIGVLLSMAGVFWSRFNRHRTLTAALEHLCSALRLARLRAQASQVGEVVLDTRQRCFWVNTRRLVGLWHFETLDLHGQTYGAFGRLARVYQAQLVSAKIGQGLCFAGQGWVDCGPASAYTLRQGLILSLWLYPQGLGRQKLISLGPEYYLQLCPDNQLQVCWGAVHLRSDYVLPLYRWTHLCLQVDRQQLVIVIDQIFRHAVARQGPVLPHSQARLVIGKHLQGQIDELRLEIPVQMQRYYLPARIRWGTIVAQPVTETLSTPAASQPAAAGPAAEQAGRHSCADQHLWKVAFGANGELSNCHDGPVRLELISTALSQSVICQVGLLGDIEHCSRRKSHGH